MVAKVVIEAMTDIEVETPSGKGAADENFPVGSWLLPAALRPHVATYYAFARAIDDIADNTALAPEDKIARLSAFEEALLDAAADGPGLEKATRLRLSLASSEEHTSELQSLMRIVYAVFRLKNQ